jgi:hypothetical protein
MLRTCFAIGSCFTHMSAFVATVCKAWMGAKQTVRITHQATPRPFGRQNALYCSFLEAAAPGVGRPMHDGRFEGSMLTVQSRDFPQKLTRLHDLYHAGCRTGRWF